jgi:hypothetical protein
MKWEFGRASDNEGLRLILAFFKVSDPQQRKLIIEMVEAFAETGAPDHTFLDHGVMRGLVQDNAQLSSRKF